MPKNSELVMVVKRELLFRNDYFQGFRPANEVNYKSRILENFEWMKRANAERNSWYKQPIGYVAIVNPISKQIFSYQRPSTTVYSEKRLHEKWSWGVGGHIEKSDTKWSDPIEASVLRELKEELGMEAKNQELKLIGYINNDTDEVGKVHFGLLYIVEILRAINPKETEIKNGKMRTIEELEKITQSMKHEVEEWSKISLKPLKEYLERI